MVNREREKQVKRFLKALQSALKQGTKVKMKKLAKSFSLSSKLGYTYRNDYDKNEQITDLVVNEVMSKVKVARALRTKKREDRDKVNNTQIADSIKQLKRDNKELRAAVEALNEKYNVLQVKHDLLNRMYDKESYLNLTNNQRIHGYIDDATKAREILAKVNKEYDEALKSINDYNGLHWLKQMFFTKIITKFN